MSRGLTDEQYAEQKGRIERVIIRWVPVLGLDGWEISYEFDATDKLGSAYQDLYADGVAAVMDCHTSWEYLQATIRFDLIVIQDVNDAELEESIVHELCHVLVAEMRDWEQTETGCKHEERVVTMLAKAFVRVGGHVESASLAI